MSSPSSSFQFGRCPAIIGVSLEKNCWFMGVMFAGSSEGGVCWVMIDRVMEPLVLGVMCHVINCYAGVSGSLDGEVGVFSWRSVSLKVRQANCSSVPARLR